MSSLPISRSMRTWLFTVMAVFAMTAQLVVSLAPLAEGRVGRTMSAHVESGGTRGHVAHNEATCASCQARSIQGTAPRPLFSLPDVALASSAPVSTAKRSAPGPIHPQANPRAPPTMI